MYCENIATLIENVVAILYAVILMVGMFFVKDVSGEGALFSFLNSPVSSVLFFVLIAMCLLINKLIAHKVNKINYDAFKTMVKLNREFGYFFEFAYKYSMGKDIRIYGMQEMIMDKMKSRKDFLNRETYQVFKKELGLISVSMLSDIVIQWAAYIFVGLKALTGIITIGSLTMYTGAITQFTSAISRVLQVLEDMKIANEYIINYVRFMDLKNEKYDGTLPIEKRLDNEYELEFRNVSFHYPNNEENILKNITAKITVGKKMAIVGPNGAGKSTFIKLLCRLYDPTEGQILLNGIDIRKYDYDEYMKIFAVVFQDYTLYPFTVAQNVAVDTKYDEEKVLKCLEEAGIKDRVLDMENGINTYLYKSFDKMVEDKTAIYISHRMSSCKFCNNILVFEDGNISQTGSHDELLMDEEGMYYKLWNAQVQYYK